jgi:hypothetical protein
MNRFALLGAVTVVAAATGCSTTGKVSTIPGISFDTQPLARSEYVIIGNAAGDSCAEESCFFGSCTKTSGTKGEEAYEGRIFSTNIGGASTSATENLGLLQILFGTGNQGPSGADIAERIALYKAIESVPDADAIILPRKQIQVDTNDIPFISHSVKSCVKIHGKAVRLKTDAELASAPPAAVAPAAP